MESLNSLPLNALRAVAAVAREGSLSGAARALNVTPGAVSQQVARAEASLALRLFDRRPDGMVPTPMGAEVCKLLASGFDQIATAVTRARDSHDRVLTISVAPIFAARWLIWRLPAFNRQHPDIRVRLDNQLALVDPNNSDVDFAIRIGRGVYPGATVEHLLTQYVIPVCAASVAERLKVPADLAHVPIIREPRPQFGWEVWLGPEGLSPSILGAGPDYPDASLCFDAAMTGAGVFLSFETLCREALDRGQIIAPFPRQHPSGLSYWLVSARDRSLSEPQRAFRRWLKAEIARSGMGQASPSLQP
ncbi:LysR substrate-binding domain-containing protein [Frigidibacter sp. ROC022]|uniref:LysR substrate-binding domain-containing protein n=1 Tax=Frigidibacter sp. ROC022 TaxID=2971796 RepID=UPI00215B3D70|nr:LysR substrate-binding domain-containing protein [Frigidibacter sp. ROC022]MCR8724316.1 LysR substrate-binding domain-containing protein [Frigidibacter sp. ROC022]